MKNNNNLRQQLETAIVIVLCLLIFFLPISIAMVESLSGLALFFYFIKKMIESREQVKLTGLNGGYWHIWLGKVFQSKTFLHQPLYILAGVTFLSVLFSQYRVISVIAFIGKTMQGVALVLIVADNIKKRWHIFAFLGAFMLISMLVSLSAIYQYIYGVDFLRGVLLNAGRAAACFRHPNDLGAFLVITSAVFMGGVFSLKRPWLRCLAVLALGVVLTAFLFTFSRSAWVGFICSLGIFILLRPREWKFAVVLIGVFVFVFVPLLASKRQVGLVIDNMQSFQEEKKEVNVVPQVEEGMKTNQKIKDPVVAPPVIKVVPETKINPKSSQYQMRSKHIMIEDMLNFIRRFGGSGRAEYWVKALNIIDSAPVLGTGLNTYSKVAERYPSFWGSGYPHNCYLQMTAETGLLGLFFFLWFIGVFFMRSIKASRRIKDDQIKVIVLSLISGIAGFLIQSFFDTNLYSVQLDNFVWLMIGFAVAIIYVEQQEGVNA